MGLCACECRFWPSSDKGVRCPEAEYVGVRNQTLCKNSEPSTSEPSLQAQGLYFVLLFSGGLCGRILCVCTHLAILSFYSRSVMDKQWLNRNAVRLNNPPGVAGRTDARTKVTTRLFTFPSTAHCNFVFTGMKSAKLKISLTI